MWAQQLAVAGNWLGRRCARAGVIAAAAGIGAGAVAQTPGFYLVGEGSGTDASYLLGFTFDGLTAVGFTGDSGQIERAYRWNVLTGRIDATDPGLLTCSTFHSLSTDGTTVVGATSTATSWTDRRTVVIRTGQPVLTLPILPGFRNVTSGTRVSGDGAVVAGTCQVASGTPARRQGFRWTVTGGLQAIPYPVASHNFAVVTGISRDGSTIVGYSANTNTGDTVAFRWRASTGSIVLPAPTTGAEAQGVNADGSIIVGRSYGSGSARAVYWDQTIQMHTLGLLPWPIAHEAKGVSDDGMMMTGFARQTDGISWRAVVWPDRGAPQLASDYFESRGVTVPADYIPQVIDEVSGNGRAFGFRYYHPTLGGNRSAIVILPGPCPADFNQDGGVDGADVEEFFQTWAEGMDRADLNEDGGVDGADVERFFFSWEAGGCE